MNYVDADSPLSMLQKFWVPDVFPKGSPGVALTKMQYINDNELERMYYYVSCDGYNGV